jgi:hypothetical protein
MKLTLTPKELVPIVRAHLEAKMGLTLSGMCFVNRPLTPLVLESGKQPWEIKQEFVIEIEVAEAETVPADMLSSGWVNAQYAIADRGCEDVRFDIVNGAVVIRSKFIGEADKQVVRRCVQVYETRHP